jgi:hypothetical protein
MFVLVSAMTTIAFVLLLQVASGQMAPPVIVRPADDRTVSATIAFVLLLQAVSIR